MIKMQSPEPTRHGKYEIHDVPSRKIEWYRARGWYEVTEKEPVANSFDLSGSWFKQRGAVKQELGLDRFPASKEEAISLLEQAGYEVK